MTSALVGVCANSASLIGTNQHSLLIKSGVQGNSPVRGTVASHSHGLQEREASPQGAGYCSPLQVKQDGGGSG